MAFYSTKCPACKKDIQVPDEVEVSICMYCGQKILLKVIEQVNVGPTLKNLLGLARAADISGNAA